MKCKNSFAYTRSTMSRIMSLYIMQSTGGAIPLAIVSALVMLPTIIITHKTSDIICAALLIACGIVSFWLQSKNAQIKMQRMYEPGDGLNADITIDDRFATIEITAGNGDAANILWQDSALLEETTDFLKDRTAYLICTEGDRWFPMFRNGFETDEQRIGFEKLMKERMKGKPAGMASSFYRLFSMMMYVFIIANLLNLITTLIGM